MVMGCNIHGFLEVNIWYDRPEMNRMDWHGLLKEPPLDRSYALFKVLAGVRDYGQEVEPISRTPRGLPEQLSCEMSNLVEAWEGDGHSHSWISGHEIMNYNWLRYRFGKQWEDWFRIAFKIIRMYGEDNVRFVFFFDN